jgi:cytochrome c oxidase subunit IV
MGASMTDAEPHASSDHAADEHACYAHVVPLWLLIAVFAALILLTGLTVLLHEPQWRERLGDWGLVAAMAIATLKAVLVALYFMHLRYDKPFHAIIFLAALLFVGLFLSLTVLDTLEYRPDIEQYDELPGP